jgi:tRNA dimethylallyltransferase
MVSPRLITVQGATASGKSGLALALARAWNAEIIGADSMQVFAGMEIGTAAPTLAEVQAVPHHLIGCWQPDEEVSAARWSDAVDALIRAHPDQRFIIVGGSNMWIRLWLQGLVRAPPADDAVRARLEELTQDELRARLQACDPLATAKIHANDRYRTVRALAHYEQTGEPLGQAHHEHGWGKPRYPCLRVALLPERPWLHGRIERRAEIMYADGLVDEAVSLRERYGAIKPLSVLGYRDALALADGEIDASEALHRTQRDTRRYAKSQETWIRKDAVEVLRKSDDSTDRSSESLAAEVLELLAGPTPKALG